MAVRYRHRRTSNPAVAFPSTLEPGELAVNTANRQIAAGDADSGTLGAPLVMLVVRAFDARAQYATGDFVVRSGALYRAKNAVSPGAFNAANWQAYADTQYVDDKVATVGAPTATTVTSTPVGDISATNVQAAIAELDSEKAPLASPTFTGDAKLSVTPSAGDNDTSIATTAFVKNAVDTGDAAKVSKTGDTMTGNLTISKVDPFFSLNKSAAAQNNILRGAMGSVARWDLYLGDNTAEDAANNGSRFLLIARDNAGAGIGNALVGDRATALLSVKADPTAALGIATKQYVDTGVTAKVAKAGDTMTGNLTIANAGPGLTLNKAASGQANVIYGQTAGLVRWAFLMGGYGAETGSNAGSDWALYSYNDAGAFDSQVLGCVRSSGLMYVKADPTAALGIATKQYVDGKTAVATAAEYINNTAGKLLTTDVVWAAAATLGFQTTATYTPNFNSAIDHWWNINSATGTLNNPSAGFKIGQKGIIIIVQDATGGRAITTWGTNYKFPGGVKPTLTTTANAVDIISYFCTSGSAIYCTFSADVK